MGQGVAQLRTAPVDARANGAQLDAEELGDLLIAEALDVAEDDGDPEVRGQRVECGLDVGLVGAIVEQLGRPGLAGRESVAGVLGQPLEPDARLAACWLPVSR